MKKLVIADITSLKKNEQNFGHFNNVAELYKKIFENKFDVKIAGGPVYNKKYKDFILLKYDNDIENMDSAIDRLKVKIKEIINGISLVRKKDIDILIFQAYSLKSILLSLIFSKKNKKVYLIQYRNELDNKIAKILYKLVKYKINGIICSNDKIVDNYNLRYITVSDYIYTRENEELNSCKTYDLGMLGIMSEGKDVEDIVNTFKGTQYNVIIAGYFKNIERYNKLIKNKTDNIKIVNKYLDDKEYNDYIKKSKYIILPYKEYYKNATSGVIFDVLFNKVPVITKNYDNFKFIKDYNIGLLYNKTLAEINKDNISDENLYKEICSNIDLFIKDNIAQVDQLIKFIDQ